MNFDELWIGDLVWSESLQRNVKWEGQTTGNRARIRLFDHLRTVPLGDLSPAKISPSPESKKTVKKNSTQPHRLPPASSAIDLHIEKLNPDLQHVRAEVILEYQLKMCRKFVKNAIQHRLHIITIIHGKGEGVLRLEVHHMLEDFEEFHYAIPSNQNGATEVWLRY